MKLERLKRNMERYAGLGSLIFIDANAFRAPLPSSYSKPGFLNVTHFFNGQISDKVYDPAMTEIFRTYGEEYIDFVFDAVMPKPDVFVAYVTCTELAAQSDNGWKDYDEKDSRVWFRDNILARQSLLARVVSNIAVLPDEKIKSYEPCDGSYVLLPPVGVGDVELFRTAMAKVLDSKNRSKFGARTRILEFLLKACVWPGSLSHLFLVFLSESLLRCLSFTDAFLIV